MTTNEQRAAAGVPLVYGLGTTFERRVGPEHTEVVRLVGFRNETLAEVEVIHSLDEARIGTRQPIAGQRWGERGFAPKATA